MNVLPYPVISSFLNVTKTYGIAFSALFVKIVVMSRGKYGPELGNARAGRLIGHTLGGYCAAFPPPEPSGGKGIYYGLGGLAEPTTA